MKKLLALLLCLYLFAGYGDAIASEEGSIKLNYTARDLSGRQRWQAISDINKSSDGVYAMTEKGEGIYSSFKSRISWTADLEFERTKDNVRPVSLKKSVLDDKGNIIRLESQDFDYSRKLVSCIHDEPAGKIHTVKKFRLKRDVVNRLSLGFYTKKMLENGRKSALVQMISEEPNVYDIWIKAAGEEIIEVNGRKVKARLFSIEPELGLFNFVKVLLPKARAWHSAAPGYELLRYSGPEGGIRSEMVEVTIT